MSTTNRGYATPATGTEIDTWGDVLNANFGLIDSNLGSVLSLAATAGGSVTLDATQSSNGTIVVTGSIASNYQIVFPAIQAWWSIVNLTTGAGVVTINAAASSVVTGLEPGVTTDILINGTDVIVRNPKHQIGSYWDYAGASVPAWVTACSVPPYLLCDGTSYSQVTYPYLYAIMGTTTRPDARGRARVPLNGGTGRLTTASSGVDGDTRFAAGGSQAITLDTTQMPVHSHGTTDPGHFHAQGFLQAGFQASAGASPGPPYFGQYGNTLAAVTGITINNAGGSQPHINAQPTYVGGITMIRAA